MLFDGLSWLSPAMQLSCFWPAASHDFLLKRNIIVLYYVLFQNILAFLAFFAWVLALQDRLVHYIAESNASPTGREGERGIKGFFSEEFEEAPLGESKVSLNGIFRFKY